MRVALALPFALLLWACAEPAPIIEAAPLAEPAPETVAVDELSLRPRLEPIGLSRVDERLTLTALDFNAEIFLLPEALDDGPRSDAVGLSFHYEEGQAVTSSARALRVSEAGRFQVLVRVRPGPDGYSVRLTGHLDHEEGALTALEERGEAGPIAARDKWEAGPIAARDEDEAGPIAARDEDEAGPIAARDEDEAGPIAARDEDEAGPIAARDEDEAGPIAARDEDEAGPIAARDKGEAGPIAARDEDPSALGLLRPDRLSLLPLSVDSEEAFEFYAGVVDVGEDAQELLVTWDVRFWIRTLLADVVDLDTRAPLTQAGFQDMPSEFRLIAR
ncbi:hypothetical protein KKB55_17270 [Myxococcota bacterium]|nr:hypothetical protein [Myxococcota bacterium]